MNKTRRYKWFAAAPLLLAFALPGGSQAAVKTDAAFQPGRNSVIFKSAGSKLKGDLYLPSDFNNKKKYAAILFDGPMTGLKDQVAGLYARKMSDRGFITLAFDHRFYGESEGMPRQMEAPGKKVEDNKNAVTYLLTLPFIDGSKVGAIGICAGGGYMAKTAAEDNRVKVFAGVAAAYHDSSLYEKWFGGKDKLEAFIGYAAAARKKFEQTGEVEYKPAVWSEVENSPAAMPGQEPSNEPFAYYGTRRSYSPYYVNRVAIQGYEDQLRFDALRSAGSIKAPTLIVHGTQDKYCSPAAAAKFYDALVCAKEYFSITTTNHIDLYDQEQYVNQAVAKLSEWFTKHLK
ncbi:MAG: alpha/beta hydrolase [Elusimicrobiota bacterium]|nr:alpha/beta hydrolase [Elusimicrobiota bacterium]